MINNTEQGIYKRYNMINNTEQGIYKRYKTIKNTTRKEYIKETSNCTALSELEFKHS